MDKSIEALKLALEVLEDIFGKNKVDVTVINVIKQVLKEHAMRETQRLGQEIERMSNKVLAQPEKCNYPDCKCPTENPCLKGLAQPEQEPVAEADRVARNKKVRDKLDSLLAQAGFQPDSSIRNLLGFLNFDAPPQRTWVGLTGLDQKELMAMSARDAVFATEAKLKEKNT